MYTTSVTKKFTFDAAHSLENYKGPCSNLHGHTYVLEVTLSGEVNPDTGMIIDFNDLKQVVDTKVLGTFDHKHINKEVDYNPTAENMAQDIFGILDTHFTAAQLPIEVCRIRLWETPNSFATVKRNDY